MLNGCRSDITKAELIHKIRTNRQRMRDLPVARFLHEEDISQLRGVLDANVGVVRIREPTEDRSPTTQLLISANGVLIRIVRNIPPPIENKCLAWMIGEKIAPITEGSLINKSGLPKRRPAKKAICLLR